jgi:hypothetical protein
MFGSPSRPGEPLRCRENAGAQGAAAPRGPGQHRPRWRATVESADISEALDDTPFTGGKLNVKLLGGAREVGGG